MINLFKSKERKAIESKIRYFEKMILEVKSEKESNLINPYQYAHFWSIQKGYEQNLKLLKGLL
jgi:hypothetical protein